MNLILWQTIYILGGIFLLPFFPFLYLQGQIARRKAGKLPEASGAKYGKYGTSGDFVKLFAIGESTVAGVGAETHESALVGQFAGRLSQRIGKSVHWHVVGKSGVTAERALKELFPNIPAEKFDYILIGLGGNDVLKLSSPRKWRRDILSVINSLREKNPGAVIFLSNCPMIKLSPIIPHPLKFILWRLSRLHDANIRDLTGKMDRVFYYHQPTYVPEGFFADGIHPSEKGYADWSEAMIKFFAEKYDW